MKESKSKSLFLLCRLNLSNDMAGKVTQTVKVEGSALANTCLLEPECSYNRYRSADGSCNNLKSPNMGRSLTQMDRILPPDYDDGKCTKKAKGLLVRDILAQVLSVLFTELKLHTAAKENQSDLKKQGYLIPVASSFKF